MDKQDKELLESYCYERGVKQRTYYGYQDSIKKFNNFTGRTLVESLKLYEDEEEQGIRWKRSTLKKELLTFRQSLYNNYLPITARIHFQKICTLIRHYEILIGNIPKVNKRNVKDLRPVTYEDLLTHEELQKILINTQSNMYGVMKPLITFMVSSGTGRRESLNLTVEDYLLGNEIIIDSDDIYSLVKKVDENFIPCLKLNRQKTNKFYYTFCTPQANKFIKEYLLNRPHLKSNSQLFKINLDYLNNNFRELNDNLNLGTCRNWRRCRCHMFRKYNASTLFNNGMSMNDIDSLQGRGKDSTHSAYFMEDPNLLKQKYEQYVEVLTI